MVLFRHCCLGRTIAPPPSYPPPPVPYHPMSALSKGPPQMPPPIPKKPAPSCPVPTPCSLPPSFPPPQTPTPQPACLRGPRGPMAGPPLPSLDSLKKQINIRTVSTMPPSESRDRRTSPVLHVQHPATLPICRDLEKKVVLDPKHLGPAPPGRPPPLSLLNHSPIHKPLPPMVPSSSSKPQCQTPGPSATSPNLSLVKPKLPPPKPPIPGQGKPRGPSLQ